MKNFTIYLFSLFCVLVFAEVLLTFSPNNYSYKASFINNNPQKIKTLIIGASHAENCINPSLLGDSVFNLGGSGKPYYYDVEVVCKNMPKMTHLKNIIMTIAPFQQYRSYKHNINPSDNLSALEPYIRNMHLKYLGIHYERYDYWYYLELPNSKGNLISHIKQGRRCDSLGYSPLKKENRIKDWENNQLPQPIDYSNNQLSLAYEENLSYLKKLASLCKYHNINLIFVSIPYYKNAQYLLPEKDVKGMYKMIDAIKQVNLSTKYYNYIYDNRFNEDDFFNAVHLDEQGTDKFTRILRHDIFYM
mgnify:CR=1 FL=1